MALSKEIRGRLVAALTDRRLANELADAIDAMHAIRPAAHVDSIGINTETDTEVRLKRLEEKIDAIIMALITSKIMS